MEPERVTRLPYRLPELIAAPMDAIVYIPEGEADVDRLRGEDLVATTIAKARGPSYGRTGEYLIGISHSSF